MAIEDLIEEVDEQTYLTRLLERLEAGVDRSEGGFPWDVLSPTAIEFVLANERARLLLAWGFAQTTHGELLDLRAEEHGVIRRPAVPARGVLRFTGLEGTVIPLASAVSTESSEGVLPQVFATEIEAIIPVEGFIDVAVIADEPGAAGNVAANEVHIPAAPVPGLTSVTNPDPMTDGADQESDEVLLARYLQRVRNPGSSGNVADYTNWALEVPGVGAVAVVALEDGPGTVTVAIADLDKLPASPTKVEEVQDFIAPGGLATGTGKAPIGAAVTVEAAGSVDIDVEATLVVAPGFDIPSVEAAAQASVDSYLKSLAFTDDNDVRHAKVVTSIIDTPGVTDATDVGIRTGADPFADTNIPIGAKDLAVLGVVTWA